MFPEDLRYTAEHEWVRIGDGGDAGADTDADTDADVATIGITDYAQEALGDIVYVSLPEVGTEVTAGQAFGEVESTKSVSDVYAPVTGRVVARNDRLDAQPELVNADPYGDGWIVEIETDPAALDGLLDAAAYRALVENH